MPLPQAASGRGAMASIVKDQLAPYMNDLAAPATCGTSVGKLSRTAPCTLAGEDPRSPRLVVTEVFR
jgi:hypothetical protein